MSKEPHIPLDKMVAAANLSRALYPNVDIWFWGECPKCESLCVFQDPNMYYPQMECAKCQHVFNYTEGGLLTVTRNDTEVNLESENDSRDN